MENIINIVCPISNEKINENVARIAALFTIIFAGLSLIFKSYFVIAILAVDFAMRAYTASGNSLVRYVSKQTAHLINIGFKPVDAASKKFAAEIGFIFCLAIGILQIFEFYFAADILGGVLILFAALEAGINLCAGCIVYTYFVLPVIRKKSSRDQIYR